MNDLAAALAALPQRRDFAFSPTLGRAAWLHDDALEWLDDASPGGSGVPPGMTAQVSRLELGLTLPEGTSVELVDERRVGLCRPTDAGVELLVVDLASGGQPVHKVAALATPRTCLLPRVAGEPWQLLAVTGFDDTAALLRIDWAAGTWTEAGRLPQRVDGGVWLEEGRRICLNLAGPTGRASAYAVDLEEGRCNLLFEASPDSDDRAVLFDPDTGHLVVTTDAPGFPAVGVARLGDDRGVRFLAPLGEGDEAARPCGFLGPASARRLLLHHEVGPHVRLRTANLETLEVGAPLPVPDGEVGRVIGTDGATVRFAFSAPDLPWTPARLDLATGRFGLDLVTPEGPPLFPARRVDFPGPAGPMPAVVLDPDGEPDFVVVALHGGPITRWGSECQAELQLLAHQGAQVVALDYPGSTGSGRDFMHSLFGEAGIVDVEAVISVVDHFGAGRVVLYGESYGAFLALAVAAVRPVAGVGVFSPFASFSGLKRHATPEVRDLLDLLDAGNPDKPGRNLLKGCRTTRSKVLIAHGTADLTIPIGESRALARALRGGRNAGDEVVRLVELDNQGHDLTDRRVLERWYRELIGFAEGLPRRDRLPNENSKQQGR